MSVRICLGNLSIVLLAVALCGCSSDSAPVAKDQSATTQESRGSETASPAVVGSQLGNPAQTISEPAPAKDSKPASQESAVDLTSRLASAQKERTLRSIFDRARVPVYNSRLDDDLAQNLQPVLSELPVLEVSTKPAVTKWNRLTLNRLGERFDVVRFHTPADGPVDLNLCFYSESAVRDWNVLPLTEPQKNRGNFDVEWNVKVEGLDLPEENKLTFYADRRGFQPDTDYCLWFQFLDTERHQLSIAMSLLPTDGAREAQTAPAIAADMGVRYQAPQFAADSAGVRQALKYAQSLWSQGGGGGGRFRKALTSVAAALPELTVGRDRKIAWNTITLNKARGEIEAYRFRSPLDGPADLQYVIAEPNGHDIGYGVVPPTGFLKGPEGQLEIDLRLKGVDFPPQNITYLQVLPFGQFQPGQDYVIWVATGEDGQAKTQVGLHFSPATPLPKVLTTADIAASVGIQLPETVDSSRDKFGRQVCRVWCQQHGDLENVLLRQGLQSIAPAFRNIEITNGDQPLVWNSVPLNADGVRFDAVRFKSPLAVRAEFYCAFADSRNLRWQLVAARGYGGRVDDIHNAAAAKFDVAGSSKGSQLTLAGEAKQRWFGIIEPGQEYLLWFMTPDDAPARELRLAVHLQPASTPRGFTSAGEIATRMGLSAAAAASPTGTVLLGKHTQEIVDLAFSRDGKTLASLDRTGSVNLWDIRKRSLEAALALEKPRRAGALKLSPDERLAVVALGEPAEAIVWDLKSRTIKYRLKFPELSANNVLFYVRDIAISADSTKMVAATHSSLDRGVYHSGLSLWDLKTGKKIKSKAIDGPAFTRLAWPSDSRLVTTGFHVTKTEGGGVFTAPDLTVWDAQTFEMLNELHEEHGEFADLSISESPRIVAAIGQLPTVKLWNLEDLKELPSLTTFGKSETREFKSERVALAPNGQLAAVTTPNSSLQLWDLARRRLLFTRRAPSGIVGHIAISPDGNWIAFAGKDLTLQLWDARFPDAIAVENSIGMKLVPVPAGAFVMGSPNAEQGRDPKREAPQHEVRISHDFLMGMHEVTVGQFRQFVEATSYKTTAETNASGGSHIFELAKGYEQRPELTWGNPGFAQADDHPVVQVSWNDAQEFCRWLSAKEGTAYRLPTEAEWEYACRAGSKGEYSFEDSAYFLSQVGNAADRSILGKYREYSFAAANQDDHFAFTAPVGSYGANGFGLYDLHGNVWEWCGDWFDAQYYSHSSPDDPTGPPDGQKRTLRGGSFHNGYWQCRSACRDFESPVTAQSSIGFRLVRDVDK